MRRVSAAPPAPVGWLENKVCPETSSSSSEFRVGGSLEREGRERMAMTMYGNTELLLDRRNEYAI
jgi:hypothetical protein